MSDRAASPTSTAGARSALLLAGLAAAVGVRAAVGGADVAASTPAALIFATVLAGLCAAAGWRAGRIRPAQVAIGAAGAVVLVAAWWLGRGGALPPGGAGALGQLALWSPVVVAVAVAEEALLRGALFEALQSWRGPLPALAVTSVAFAAMHVPLYGAGAIPLDLAVGLWLGGLRMLTGSWAAPAVAHALADLAGGWL